MNSVRIRFCSWCRCITVFPGRADDVVSVMISGNFRFGMVNAEPVIIQDGICEPCKAKEFPETIKTEPAVAAPKS